MPEAFSEQPQFTPCRHIVFFDGVKRLGETCDDKSDPASLNPTPSPPRPALTRVPAPILPAPLQAGLWRMLPKPDRHRMKAQGRGMQLSAVRGDQAGAPFAVLTDEKYPTARQYRSTGRYRLRRQGRRALTKRRPSARKVQSMRYVRLSGSPASASSLRFQACETSKQPTRWAPRKTANVQSAPISRQYLAGTLME
jgi:hypothetical protein